MSAGAEAVLALYRDRINLHHFDELRPLIADDALFWFGDGSHEGIEAIRQAFEATWSVLTDETYWLDDLRWLALNDKASVCTYRFHWRATVRGALSTGTGRGTSVLMPRPSGWRIVHEHLSAAPALG